MDCSSPGRRTPLWTRVPYDIVKKSEASPISWFREPQMATFELARRVGTACVLLGSAMVPIQLAGCGSGDDHSGTSTSDGSPDQTAQEAATEGAADVVADSSADSTISDGGTPADAISDALP